VISGVSKVMMSNPKIMEVDLNPVMVDGRKVVPVDVRMLS